MKMRTATALLVALTILATACADAPTEPGDGGGTGGGGIAHPTGGGDVLLRISSEGGFVPVEYLLTSVPGFTLFGDGTVVTQGAQTEIYPGPALPPMIATPVTEAGIQALLEAAVAAGLDEDQTYTDMGSVGVADATTTVFTLTVDGVSHVTKVYALGMMTGEQPPRMSDEEYAVRTKLERLQASLQDLRTTLPDGAVGEDATFTPGGLRLFITAYRGADLKQPPVEWPLSTPIASVGEPTQVEDFTCAALTGADLEAVLPLAQSANQLTPWKSDGERYTILSRPLLPDESGC